MIKKRKIKISAFVIALLILVSVFCGCNDVKDPPFTTQASTGGDETRSPDQSSGEASSTLDSSSVDTSTVDTSSEDSLEKADSTTENPIESKELASVGDYLKKGKYMKAAATLSLVSFGNTAQRNEAQKLIVDNITYVKKGITDSVTEYMVRYRIDEGKKFLDGLKGLGIDDVVASEYERLEKYRVFQDVELEKVYLRDVGSNAGTLENIYTHCLIAFPEINFESEKTYRRCGDDCLTPHEFTYLLDRLYSLGYIIIDANLLYDSESGKVVSTLMLPKGKKPLVFTFDDVTYDSRKLGRGMVDKLIVDEDGYICTYTKSSNGKEIISYENEIFPIINDFVRKHPDFTFHGGRGTLFFTGFDGILGYRTQSEPVDDAEAALKLDRKAEIAEAKKVVSALREEGWTFGSHSYAHRHMTRYSAKDFKADTDLWLSEVGSIIGETQLFCWPYGDHTDKNYNSNLRKGELHQYLFDKGFHVFFGCGSARYLAQEPDGLGVFTDRKGMTGNVLYYIEMEYKSYLRDYLYLIEPEKMWDPLRLPYKFKPPYKAD